MKLVSALCCFAVAVAAMVAQATEYNVTTSDDLFGLLGTLSAGDSVFVFDGVYSSQSTSGSWYRSFTWTGSAASPIVVRAVGSAAILSGDPSGSQNVLNVGGSYYTFAGFEIRYGSHGLRVLASDHATIEDLHIHDTGDVALSCNIGSAVYSNIAIRHNHIHDTGGTGEGMYLGCNNNGCVVHSSVIERNLVHDTNHGTSQGDGIELKTGSYGNILRDNVIYNTYYPAITMYGTAGAAQNIVEGNFIHDVGDNCIQAVGDITIRNNVMLNCGANGIQAKPSQENIVKALVIVQNTVVGSGAACLKGNDWTTSATGIVVRNNAFYCSGTYAIRLVNGDGGATSVINNNGVLGSLEGVDAADTIALNETSIDLVNTAAHNVFPTAASALRAAVSRLSVATKDFDGWDRETTTTLGAYEYHAGGPVWTPTDDFKTSANDTDDGSGGGGGGGGGGDAGSDDSTGTASTVAISIAVAMAALLQSAM